MGPTRYLLLKLLLSSATLAAAFLLLTDIAAEIGGGRTPACYSRQTSPAPTPNYSDLDAAFRYMIAMSYLAAGDRTLFISPDSSSTAAAIRRAGLSASVSSSSTGCCYLPFDADFFDFAFAASLERVRVPAGVVLEMERVVRPGRFGVVLWTKPGLTQVRPEDLMKAATPIASLLRLSHVIGARVVNGSDSAIVFVVFKKRGPSTNRKNGRRVKCYNEISKMPLILDGSFKLLQSAVRVCGGPFWSFSRDLI